MKNKSCFITIVLIFFLIVFLSPSIAEEFGITKESTKGLSEKNYSPYAGKGYPQNVYWGDTHLHTSYSADAGLVGNTNLGPEKAYEFARGDEITSNHGKQVKLIRPLDFLVVADHAEYLGLIPKIRESDPSLLKTEFGKRWHDLFKGGPDDAYQAAVEVVNSMGTRDEKIKDNKIKRSAWEYITEAADNYNDPGKFTAFIGYEWSSMPNGGNNLHRVVIFRDDANKANQILPFSAFDSEDPEDLWDVMDVYEEKTSGQVLALAHNGNVSNGLMFNMKDFKGNPITKEYAEKRSRWEPLYEVTQMKGDGETHPLLSPNDEFADYETWDKGNLLGNAAKEQWMLQYEYARSALKLGLQLEEKIGTNPYKFGMVGSTDSHTSLATAREENFWGKISQLEPEPERYKHFIIESQTDKKLSTFGWEQVASGYAAVWATENTREGIFDAMQRKEVYATTGTRMIVRFFGGWDYTNDDAFKPNVVEIGYENGVPMGGDLRNTDSKKSPTFMVGAMKDPDGANLDRVQIIKGWLDAKGELHEKIYNVALSDERKADKSGKINPVGNTVDIKDASYTNTIGDAMLRAFWKDPEFDPKQHAVYYARVIEIPTPRWIAFDAKIFNVEMPKDANMITQERAYTSPIWYTP